jgi:hypothetical protein
VKPQIRKSRQDSSWELWTEPFTFHSFPTFDDALLFLVENRHISGQWVIGQLVTIKRPQRFAINP